MNVGGLERRVSKLEREAKEGKERKIHLVFQNYDESASDAMAKAGLQVIDDNDIVVYIIKWASGNEHQYPAHQQPAAAEPDTLSAPSAMSRKRLLR